MKDLGQPFAEITGPGVVLVQSMMELENEFREMGIEAEFQVESEEASFVWPMEGQV